MCVRYCNCSRKLPKYIQRRAFERDFRLRYRRRIETTIKIRCCGAAAFMFLMHEIVQFFPQWSLAFLMLCLVPLLLFAINYRKNIIVDILLILIFSFWIQIDENRACAWAFNLRLILIALCAPFNFCTILNVDFNLSLIIFQLLWKSWLFL